jgi:hypothetical protein
MSKCILKFGKKVEFFEKKSLTGNTPCNKSKLAPYPFVKFYNLFIFWRFVVDISLIFNE